MHLQPGANPIRTPRRLQKLAAIFAAFMLLGAMTPPADATNQSVTPKAAKKRQVKPKFVRSASEESNAERDRRLVRECRGRPNAGACLGYAR